MELCRLWNSPTLSTWASLAVRSLDLVVVLPLVLHRFESAEVALWYLFLSVLTLQQLVESGFGNTFIRVTAYAMGGARQLADLRQTSASESRVSPSWERLAAIRATQSRLYSWLMLATALAVLLLGTWALARPIAASADSQAAWYAWGAIVLTGPVILRGQVFAAFLQGVGKVALFRRWEALSLALAAFATISVLIFGGELLHLVIVRQIWALANVALNVWLCRRSTEWQHAARRGAAVDPQVLAAVWPSAWRSVLGVAMSAGLVEASGFVVAQLEATAAVAAYLVAMRLIQGVNQFSQAPFYSRLPELAKLWSEGRLEAQVALARRGMTQALWTFVAGFLILGFLGESVLFWIGRPAAFVPQSLWCLLGLAFFVERYGAMHLQLYSTTNHILWHIANGVSGALYLLTVWVLYRALGVYAFPVAMLVGHLSFYTWFSVRLSYSTFGLRFWSFERLTLLSPLLVMLAYAMLRGGILQM